MATIKFELICDPTRLNEVKSLLAKTFKGYTTSFNEQYTAKLMRVFIRIYTTKKYAQIFIYEPGINSEKHDFKLLLPEDILTIPLILPALIAAKEKQNG